LAGRKGLLVPPQRRENAKRRTDEGTEELRERRMLEDRLAAVETLAAGLAHEINNPLTYTLINVENVLRRMRALAASSETEDVARELVSALPAFVDSLDQTLHGMKRVREVVRGLMTFSRGGASPARLVDARGIAESAIQMSLHEVVHRARLVRDLREVPPVYANEAALGQVFLSLIVNAAQAIEFGDPRDNKVTVSTRTDETGSVVVEVTDTGAGIEPEVLPRIFEPFFTSRGPDNASGLGLSMAYGTVRRFGGTINVASVPGKGTSFRVVLPPARGWRNEDAPLQGERQVGARRRVLIVDDDVRVGRSLAKTLEDVAEVMVVTDASAVVERLTAGERWDTILCDLLMPEMSGIDFYREALRIAPDAASSIVFMTAGAFTRRAQEFLASVSNPCLEKPFDVARLRRLVTRTSD
jgi:signal transduction histidine kinase/CheY-like chemotaxis protein